MQKSILLTLAIWLVSPLAHARSQDNARAVIEKAIDATGGRERLRQCKSSYTKLSGTFYYSGNPEAFTAEVYSQLPEQYRASIEGSVGGQKYVLIQVSNRGRFWTREDGNLQKVDGSYMADIKSSQYVDYISTLLPLVEEKAFELSVAGDASVGDQPAVRVSVKRGEQPEVFLYFSKTHHWLVKTEYRFRDPQTKQEQLHEEVLTDYREIKPVEADERVLKAAGAPSDNDALLEFLRKRTLQPGRSQEMEKLIQQLGDPSFDVRERAESSLKRIGSLAVPLLSRASQDPDPEIARRAAECLKQIGQSADPTVPLAVVHLLAYRKPAGAVQTLLGYLPNSPEPKLSREIESALASLAFPEGKPDPAILQAANDSDPHRRSAAERILKEGQTPAGVTGTRLFPTGVKFAMRGTKFEGRKIGQKTIDWTITELQFFNRIDDRIFDKP